MKLKTIALFVAVVAVLGLSSCSSSKSNKLPYFQDLPAAGTIAKDTPDIKIRPDDELVITVTSSTPEATVLYNLPQNPPAYSKELAASSASTRIQTYIVDSKGDINFPQFGMLHVAGMSVEALRDLLQERIRKDVHDAVVQVVLVNFMVNVGGEVHNPKNIEVKRQRFSVLDALATAGDLTEYGDRSNVLVIRENGDGTRSYGHINLTSSEALTSPYYYLQQNDYVYVTPNKIRESNSKYNTNNAYKLQITSTIVSAASVIASLVIALTVK